MIQFRGYPEQLLDRRETIAQTVFSNDNTSSNIAEAINEIQALNRPVAIHYEDNATPSLIWLRNTRLGFQLYSDGMNTVWYIDRQVPLASH